MLLVLNIFWRLLQISNNYSLHIHGTYHVPGTGLDALKPVFLLIYSSAQYFKVGGIIITASNPILKIRKQPQKAWVRHLA